MTSYLVDLLKLFWTGYGLIFLGVFAAVIAFAPSRQTKIGGTLVLLLMAAWPVWLYLEANQEEARLIERNRAMNALFEKRCKEDARITIKRVVENVDGVFVVRPREQEPYLLGASDDQFWMGDPYGYSFNEESRMYTLLEARKPVVDHLGSEAPSLSGYKFLEMPNPDRKSNPAAPAYLRVTWEGEKNAGGGRIFKKLATNERLSKFGYDWTDVSTSDDRNYWIAGGKTRIMDMQTDEVIAERVGFVVDRMQGKRVGGGTWMTVWDTACPPVRRWGTTKAQDFLETVLRPPKESPNGK